MQPSEDNSDGIREPLVIRLPGSVDRIYQRFTDDSKGYLRRSNKGNQINADEYSRRTGMLDEGNIWIWGLSTRNEHP